MRYAQITPFEVCNGKGAGVSLFVQGCPFHCKGCFNPETWNFEKGKEWTNEVENTFFELIDQPYIKRVSILGGEPLAKENVEEVLRLIKKIRHLYGDKKEIWLYTGYELEYLLDTFPAHTLKFRNYLISYCEYIIDGEYIDSLKDTTLKFRGSSNQRIWKQQNGLWKQIKDKE